MREIAFGRLGLSVRDFMLMTPLEVLEAGNARMDQWHLQNVVNASFFTTLLQVQGAKKKGGGEVTRQDLYKLPDEKTNDGYLDASTPEGRKEIRKLIKESEEK